MKITIHFNGMEASTPLEQHANDKLLKIEDVLGLPEGTTPFDVTVWLRAHKTHPHHQVELHVTTPQFKLDSHDEGTDMYVMLDNAIDKMVKLITKAKAKQQEKNQKPDTEKKDFTGNDDKYTLS